jgi:hypothetical protein
MTVFVMLAYGEADRRRSLSTGAHESVVKRLVGNAVQGTSLAHSEGYVERGAREN